MDENQIFEYLESERFYNVSDEPRDLQKSDKEKGIVDWNIIKLNEQTKFLGGDVKVFQTFQKAIRENNPVYEASFDGKQHLSTKILMLESGALFLKEAKKSAAENEGLVYGLAKMCGLAEYMEPTCSLKIGESFYSASNMIPTTKFKSLTAWKRDNPDAMDGFLQKMADTGMSHKLAAFDYVINNLDRNRGNVFSDGENLRVIDNGRAFLSKGFAFIPGFLRKSDNELIVKGNEDAVRLWIGGVKADRKLFLMHAYLDKLDLGWKSSVCGQISQRWAELAAKNPVRGPGK